MIKLLERLLDDNLMRSLLRLTLYFTLLAELQDLLSSAIISINCEAFATELAGKKEGFFYFVYFCVLREVDCFANCIVCELLEGCLNSNVPFGRNIKGGAEDAFYFFRKICLLDRSFLVNLLLHFFRDFALLYGFLE